MILAIRTDHPHAELHLINQDGRVADKLVWPATNELSKVLLANIEKLLKKNKLKHQDLTGVIVFRGPGSFTGLRIGVAVANALAYSLGLPIAGATSDDWLKKGLMALAKPHKGQWVVPEYGAEPNISQPKK